MKFTLWAAARAGFILTLVIWAAADFDNIVTLGEYALHVDTFTGELTIAVLPSYAPAAPESVSRMVPWFKDVKTPVAMTPIAGLWLDDMPLMIITADLWILHLVFLLATILTRRWNPGRGLNGDLSGLPAFSPSTPMWNRWLTLRIASPIILWAFIMLTTWGQQQDVILQALVWPLMAMHFGALCGFPRTHILDTIAFVLLIPAVFSMIDIAGQNGREFYVRIGVAVEAFLAYSLMSYWGMRRIQEPCDSATEHTRE